MESYDYQHPRYGITRVLNTANFDGTVAAIRSALAQRGFGVLSEINLKATLKAKLDEDVPEYLILGACNPKYAHQALMGEPGVGLLLPCNVVVARGDEGIVVSAVDPTKLFEVMNNPGVQPIAEEVAALLSEAIESL